MTRDILDWVVFIKACSPRYIKFLELIGAADMNTPAFGFAMATIKALQVDDDRTVLGPLAGELKSQGYKVKENYYRKFVVIFKHGLEIRISMLDDEYIKIHKCSLECGIFQGLQDPENAFHHSRNDIIIHLSDNELINIVTRQLKHTKLQADYITKARNRTRLILGAIVAGVVIFNICLYNMMNL